MIKNTIARTGFLAALTLGLAVAAAAQSSTSSAPPPAVPGYGLLGESVSQFDFGYQKELVGSPQVLHDYGFTYNQPVIAEGLLRTDMNLTYGYLTGSAFGAHDYVNEAMGGFTEYLAQGWGSPFVTADAGGAWQHADNVARKSGVYAVTGGVELPLFKDLGVGPTALQQLVLAPFAEYQTEPYLYNHERPYAYYPDHDWTYGLRATYPVLRNVSVTLAVDWDQYSRNDVGGTLGLGFRF